MDEGILHKRRGVGMFVDGHAVLGEKRLGGTKAAMVHAAFDEDRRRRAAEDGLELGPIPGAGGPPFLDLPSTSTGVAPGWRRLWCCARQAPRWRSPPHGRW